VRRAATAAGRAAAPPPGTPQAPPPAALAALAREWRIALGYTDAFGKRRRTSTSTLVAVLRALGEPVERPEDAGPALRIRQAAPPPAEVVVAWDGRLPPWFTASAGGLTLELEGGSLVPAAGHGPLPPGVHLARDGARRAQVIAAPRRAAPWPAGAWGCFAPTYALVDDRRLPRGDLTCLEQLGQLTARLGGRFVATLPLLARHRRLGGAAADSPYSPISRMWWDEDLLDLARLPELAGDPRLRPSPPAPASPAWRELLNDGLRRLRAAADHRAAAFQRYLGQRPDLLSYGAYRAAEERTGGPPAPAAPRARPAPLGSPPAPAVPPVSGAPPVPAADDPVAMRWAYAQWATDAQLGEVAARVAGAGAGLLLDLPVGCDPAGYDPWAHPGAFAAGATIGAPPDRFFVTGQDWDLAPPHPRADREAGYPVLRSVLAHGLRHAAALRVDHVMGMQRLWWIPEGAAPADGAYLGYPAEELLALALLEASRAGAGLVGEDLGTVTPALRRMLAAHQVAGTDVAVFALEDRPAEPPLPRPKSMSTVDTHDTATFAGWLAGDDVGIRRRLGLLDEAGAAAALRRRMADVAAFTARLRGAGSLAGEATPVQLLAALLEELGQSAAGVVIATLEDCWAERDPQNVPGTTTEHANFRRPLARSLGQMANDPDLRSVLGRLDRARRSAAAAAAGAPGVLP
jgi:4-alpha-glucanotransferase